MQGKIGGDETLESLTDLAARFEQCKKDILELEKRKANISTEINLAIIAATQKLEADYDKKGRDLAITYQSRLEGLDVERTSVENLRKELVIKDTEIIEEKKKLAEYSNSIGIDRELVEEAKKQFEIVKNSQNNSLEAAKEILAEREKSLINAETLISKREEAVEVIEAVIEDRESKVLSLEESCKSRESELTEQSVKLASEKIEVSAAKRETANKLEEVSILKDKLEQSYKLAAQDRETAAKELAAIKDTVLKNEVLGKNLSELRDALSEKETTIKEKERALLIQARDIDAKIATLQKLRKE